MKIALIRTLTESFEGHAQQTEDGLEYWLARDRSSCSATPNGGISPQ